MQVFAQALRQQGQAGQQGCKRVLVHSTQRAHKGAPKALRIQAREGGCKLVNKAIKSVERARRLIEEKPEQDSNDYILLECLTDASNGLQLRQAEAEMEGGGHTWFFVCGECHTAIDTKDKYCRECGREIIWA